jgi:hypothetical protein
MSALGVGVPSSWLPLMTGFGELQLSRANGEFRRGASRRNPTLVGLSRGPLAVAKTDTPLPCRRLYFAKCLRKNRIIVS